jgi:oxalate decarboxylase/phosphoglucose isomerase-like protein (cupin superfamily)
MKRFNLAKKSAREFSIVGATRAAQAAVMTLAPGGTSDDALSNEHPRCEQWCFIFSGTGKIITAKAGVRPRTIRLRANILLAIERGERHQIVNDGDKPLTTWNMYIPPAYDSHAKPKPTVQRKRKS